MTKNCGKKRSVKSVQKKGSMSGFAKGMDDIVPKLDPIIPKLTHDKHHAVPKKVWG